jgi:hypothetical protein
MSKKQKDDPSVTASDPNSPTLLTRSIKYLAEPIFPTNEIHLWSGSTGVGKSALLLQTIADWRDGKPVFGCKPFPAPFCFIACERPLDSTLQTLDRLGIPADDRFPVVSSFDKGMCLLDQAVDLARDTNPSAKVLFLDGVTEFLKNDPNRASTISEFFLQASSLSRRHSITFVLVTCAAKVKEGERYLSPRQRISGSLAWGAKASTVVVIEAERPDDPSDPRRKVHVLPVNSHPRLFHYSLDPRTGAFVIAPADIENPTEFEEILFARPKGSFITLTEIIGICELLDLSPATMYRYLRNLVTEGKLDKPGKRDGIYQIPTVQ